MQNGTNSSVLTTKISRLEDRPKTENYRLEVGPYKCRTWKQTTRRDKNEKPVQTDFGEFNVRRLIVRIFKTQLWFIVIIFNTQYDLGKDFLTTISSIPGAQ